ncbi:MAG: O-methyltransferase [Paludibacteraceae bacterium]|nr:O-methyltransferase [Paludibacteraceae bacterium]
MDILEYIEQHSSPESDILQQIVHTTHLEMINPRMMSGHIQGRVLSMLSQMIRPRRILELGTFTAYSTLCLAEGLQQDGLLVTLEHNDELEDMILRNLSLSPLGDKVQLVIGDAMEWLGAQSTDELYDLVFIDADKREYCAYLDAVLPLVRPGGWILADNTLWDGHIIEPEYDKDKQTLALRAFNDKVAQDDRLHKVILPIRDGLTIIRKV